MEILRMDCELCRDHFLGRRAWTSLAEALRVHACIRTCVHACGYTWNAFLDVMRGKKYVYLLLGDSRGIDPRASAVSHTRTYARPIYARLLRPIHVHTPTWCFNSVKRRTLPPFISLRGYRCALKQFATVSATGFRNVR